MYQVFLGLGSNLGDRLANLRHAVGAIAKLTDLRTVSSVYETEPVHMDSDTMFLNMAVEIQTPDDPPLLLVQLKGIEKRMGRKVPSHLEPRIIDIDILLYRGLAYEDHTVAVPHPGLLHRRFALEPLSEIAPTAVHPTAEKTIATLLRVCRDRHTVRKFEQHDPVTTLHT